MRFDILTLFPEVFEPYLSTSILGRAREKKLIEVGLVNIRDFTDDNHKTVDDTPYGGGAGMVMKIEPIDKALKAIKNSPLPKRGEGQGEGITQPKQPSPLASRGPLPMQGEVKTIVLSARGQQFTQAKAAEYSKLDSLVLICGRYEGIDQRVIDHLADEEISVGPYVLAGGELPAMIVLEATARLLPGVLGNEESLVEESFSPPYEWGVPGEAGGRGRVTEYPQYTKPAEYNGWPVPDVLLSGNHAAIQRWRAEQRKKYQV